MADKQATIASMEVNKNKRCTGDEKRAMAKVLEDEFDNQFGLISVAQVKKRREFLEAYKKANGFHKLQEKYGKLQSDTKIAEDKIKNLGLGVDGNVLGKSYSNNEYTEVTEQLESDIEKAVSCLSKPRTWKNEVITRLWLCETRGEICVILKEVMSNGLIPMVTEKEAQALITEK